MKARVTEIESGRAYNDKERRVTITFESAAFGMNRLKVAESALGLREVALDMELEVEVELATGIAPGAVISYDPKTGLDPVMGQLASWLPKGVRK